MVLPEFESHSFWKMDITPPTCLKKPLVVPDKLLMGPGPANGFPRVLYGVSRPILGHLDSECVQIMDEVKEGIKYVFQTNNRLTLALSTSGHGGMEAVLCNLLEPGEKVLVAVSGIWGDRASEMARRYGAQVVRMESVLGTAFALNDFEAALEKHRPTALFVTHGESSTGVIQSVEGLGLLCHDYDCLLLVDTVASLGGVPMFMDRWNIDAMYTGSQKVLSVPPGLTPISFSPRAEKKLFNRKTPVIVYYLDMTLLGEYWDCFGKPNRIYHHTISSNLLCALREGLAMIAEEGLSNSWDRHRRCGQRLQDGLESMGLELFVNRKEDRLVTVTAVKNPTNVDWIQLKKYLKDKYSIEIAGGLGPTVNKIMRIGVMGTNATIETIDYLLKAIKEALQQTKTKSRL